MSMKSKNGIKDRVISLCTAITAVICVTVIALIIETALVNSDKASLDTVKNSNFIIHILSSYLGCRVLFRFKRDSYLIDAVSLFLGIMILHGVVTILCFDVGVGDILHVALPNLIGCGVGTIIIGKRKAKHRNLYIKKCRL